MIDKNINKFIEIGPGKVLSGLVKRINRNAELIQINDLEDLKNYKLMIDLKNTNIILTGATGGIGNSILEKLILSGANVLATGTNEDKLKSIKEKYKNVQLQKNLIFQIIQKLKVL